LSVRAKSAQTLYLSRLSQVASRSRTNPELTVFIYDRVLEEKHSGWIETFPFRFAVDSGERLKSLESFSTFCERLSSSGFDLPSRQMTVVAAGGGSVGDFAGFFASVYKRGVRLVHVPTTWLAAIDSAHGGKTALNVGGAKNQIGTFYPAAVTCLVRDVLESSGEERINDAMGELAKIALIDGGAWVRQLERSRLYGAELMWKFLKPAVDSKMKVVRKDSFEEKGLRQVLNLGHTLGHALESAFELSHGTAVAQGVFFALDYSRQKKFLKEAAFERAMSLMGLLGLAPHPRALEAGDLKRALLSDKKRDKKEAVTFVFLRGFGRPERKSVRVDDVVAEARRQGWVR
jgi:3-dehydroquinate synthase